MQYKTGDKLKPKRGCEDECAGFSRIHKDSKYITITSDRAGCYWYDIFNGQGIKLGSCWSCFKDEHLEPYNPEESTRRTDWTAGELRKLHGRAVRFETDRGVVCEGHIIVDRSGGVYVSHDDSEAEGAVPNDMLGHKYGWLVYNYVRSDDYRSNSNYKWLELLDEEPKSEPETKYGFKVGDRVRVISTSPFNMPVGTVTTVESFDDYFSNPITLARPEGVAGSIAYKPEELELVTDDEPEEKTKPKALTFEPIIRTPRSFEPVLTSGWETYTVPSRHIYGKWSREGADSTDNQVNNNKGGIMSYVKSIPKQIKKLLNPGMQAKYQIGWVDNDLELTADGRQEFIELLAHGEGKTLADVRTEFDKAAKAELKERKEAEDED